MAVEVSSDELVNLRLGRRVQVLELVHRLELDNVETVREDAVRFALEEMFALVRSDVRDRSEHVRAVRGGALNAVPVVNPALPGFVVHVEVLKIVVEVD